MRILVFLYFAILSNFLLASEDILTVRSNSDFATTLVKVNALINENNYQITLTQRCDFGLKEAGFETDEYRVVFFGKLSEVRMVSNKYPQLAPFLPLRISVIAEDKQAIVASLNPELFLETVAEGNIIKIINNWKKDIDKILSKIKHKL